MVTCCYAIVTSAILANRLSDPRIGDVRGVSFVAPIDGDHGGSWIGVNQFGLTLCLLNRYDDLNADPKQELHQPRSIADRFA